MPVPLYFAYGSNLDRAAMAARCPRSTPLGIARLARHRLLIAAGGYASVARDPRRSVWGLLWDLALADVASLDRYEDVAGGLYAKAIQPVLTPDGPRRAFIYVAADARPGAPQPGHVEAVLAAARSLGLPQEYLRDLEALVPGAPAEAPVRAVRPIRGTPPLAGSRSAKPWSPQ